MDIEWEHVDSSSVNARCFTTDFLVNICDRNKRDNQANGAANPQGTTGDI